MGEFPDELARALREWADSIHPSDALPKIRDRIRRHKEMTEGWRRYIAHYVADQDHPSPVLTVDMVFEAPTAEAAEIYAEQWGIITLAGQVLDNFHELSSGGH